MNSKWSILKKIKITYEAILLLLTKLLNTLKVLSIGSELIFKLNKLFKSAL